MHSWNHFKSFEKNKKINIFSSKTVFLSPPTLRIPPLFCFWTKSLQTSLLGYIILKFKCLSHFRSWWRHFENFRKKWISTLGGVLDIFSQPKRLYFNKYWKCFKIMCHMTKIDNFQRNWPFWPQKWSHDHR